MINSKKQMAEVAYLYYKRKLTQEKIAELLQISRQTVSKLLNNAVDERIVEIIIHDPTDECREAEKEICKKFGIKNAIVCSACSKDARMRKMMCIKAAIQYLMPIFKEGNKNIAISWGRTIEDLINEFEYVETKGNVVYPLFGATDTDSLCFSSNELARNLSNKLSSKTVYTWFPYLPKSSEEAELFKKTSYYVSVEKLWKSIDVAVLGIGDTAILELFEKAFGNSLDDTEVIGDIATHFFTKNGIWVSKYDNKLCASVDDLKNTALSVAIACGDEKAEAIKGALLTTVIDVLITDEYTANSILL